MDVVTTIAALGMQADEARLKNISQNLANISTPGYRREIAVTPTFAQQVTNMAAQPVPAASANPVTIDTTAGVLRSTGSSTDVAIEGDAFFELDGPDGALYSRQGHMHVDVRGRLVGSQGLPVMGVGGEITLSNQPFTINAAGEVRQGDRVAGVIKLVKFDHPSTLQPSGNGTYAQGGARIDDQAGDSRLRSGFIEGSNVDSAQEMVRLTETVRHFEALSKVIQSYDDSLGTAIRKLGDF